MHLTLPEATTDRLNRRAGITATLTERATALRRTREAVEDLCAIALDDGMSTREVATILGIHHSTAAEWARRARERATQPTPAAN